jgi:serine protease Do
VVGINTAIVAGGSGVGFAVPINLAKGLLPQLASKGKVSRGWLGVGIQDLSPELAERFGVKAEAGVLISQVFRHSPAAEAGMQAGDILLSIQGKPMRESRQLTNHIATLSPGKTIRLQVKRNDKNLKLRVKLGERERGEAAAFGGLAEAQTEAQEVELGLTLSPLSQDRARRLGLDPGTRGLVVDELTRSGPTAGILKKGDVILEVNRKRVTNLKEFNRALGKDRKSGLLLRIQRGNSQLYAVIRP